jgi:Tol biopolymer transport system component
MRDHLVRAGLITGLVALVAVTPAAQKTTADALFREALVKERAEGSLPEAIFRYERLIAEFGKERQVAAQAMYQLALIYQKLGDPRAVVLLTRLTKDYASVEPFAGRARERLQALQAASAGPFPSVTLDPSYESGSPDGKLVLYHKPGKDSNRQLFVKDLATGKERMLAGIAGGTFGECVWSPDSRRLACIHYQESKLADIRLIEVESGAVSRLGASGLPYDWTDTEEIFCQVGDIKRMVVDFVLVPAAGGTRRIVHSVQVEPYWQGPVITPDATRLIVSRSKKLYVQEIATGRAQPLTTGTGDEGRPVVSPDGRLVAFLANLDGHWAFYVAPLDRTLPVPNPVRLALAEEGSLEEGGSRWWTRSGLLTFSQRFSQSDLYRVDTDPRAGRAIGAPRRLTQDATLNDEPAVSPDGRRVVYWYSRQPKFGLAVMGSDGANERPLAETMGERPYWYSPDEILFRRFTPGVDKWPGPIVTLNIQTGLYQPLAGPEAAFWMYVPMRREILHWGPEGGQAKAGIMLRAWSLAEGKDRVVAQIDYLYGPGALTADGRRLAYVTARPVPGSDRCLYELALMSVDGKPEGTLLAAQSQELRARAFSPDGRYLLYSEEGSGLRVMNVATRESWPLYANPDESIWSQRAGAASWSPDGTFIIIGRSEPTRKGRLAWEGVTAEAVAKLMDRTARTPRKEER